MGAPVLILGGILGGWFTPTEAAAIGALYMLVLAVAVPQRESCGTSA